MQKLIIVGGTAASGKSWLCNQLPSTSYSYVSYDKTPKKDVLSVILSKGNLLPVVVDLHNGISTFIKRNSDKFESIELVAIIENEATIRERMIKRGGTFTEHTARRMRRMATLANKEYCKFSGTSEECLQYLLEKTSEEV